MSSFSRLISLFNYNLTLRYVESRSLYLTDLVEVILSISIFNSSRYSKATSSWSFSWVSSLLIESSSDVCRLLAFLTRSSFSSSCFFSFLLLYFSSWYSFCSSSRSCFSWLFYYEVNLSSSVYFFSIADILEVYLTLSSLSSSSWESFTESNRDRISYSSLVASVFCCRIFWLSFSS